MKKSFHVQTALLLASALTLPLAAKYVPDCDQTAPSSVPPNPGVTANDTSSGGKQATEPSAPPSGTPAPATPALDDGPKRIFFIIPNYRTALLPNPYVPLSTKEKWSIARQDTLDRGAFALAVAFGTQSFLTKADPSFGQGVGGYAHYLVTSYADWAIGNYMTEAIFPTVFHQDPRYFARLTGTKKSRLGYAVSQIFVTHNDQGKKVFNISELGGNLSAAGISFAYYPDNRTAGELMTKWWTQVGVDMAGNVLKEFWPDIRRSLFTKKEKN
jgi:hypothetical protein